MAVRSVPHNNAFLKVCFGYLFGPQGVLTKFLKPQDDMQITVSEQHHKNTLYLNSPKSLRETDLAHQGIKFQRMQYTLLESLCVTQSFFNNVAFRHVKSLQNDPVIF